MLPQDKGLEYERQLRALVAAGADMAERMPLLKEMCSATAEGIVLTLKAQVHFLRWAALGERMIAQNKGLEWAAAIHDPAALNLKGMQVCALATLSSPQSPSQFTCLIISPPLSSPCTARYLLTSLACPHLAMHFGVKPLLTCPSHLCVYPG